jgi:molybdate transport system substrate-binding protein
MLASADRGISLSGALSTSSLLNMSLRLSSSLPLTLFFSLGPVISLAQNTLTVAAAADLSLVAPHLGQAFEKTNPNVRVRFVMEASSMLAQQIENGAPYDIFLSANAQFADQLAASGKLAPRPAAYATGRLALLWRDGKQHSVNDLTRNWVRFIALANPKLAPYGAAARQALQHTDLWVKIEPKIVYGENVRQALQLFDSGNADAVFTSDGLVSDRDPQLIPADWYRPIIQKAGIVSASSKQKEAGLFLQFLLGPTAQAIFASHGFGKPTP